MDLGTLSLVIAAIATILNVIFLRFKSIKLELLWEVVYTPTAAFVAIWPLYTFGILPMSYATLFLFISILPLAYILTKKYFFFMPLVILLWGVMCILIFYNNLPDFILSNIIPGVTSLMSAIIILCVITLIMYVLFFIFNYVYELIYSRFDR